MVLAGVCIVCRMKCQPMPASASFQNSLAYIHLTFYINLLLIKDLDSATSGDHFAKGASHHIEHALVMAGISFLSIGLPQAGPPPRPRFCQSSGLRGS